MPIKGDAARPPTIAHHAQGSDGRAIIGAKPKQAVIRRAGAKGRPYPLLTLFRLALLQSVLWLVACSAAPVVEPAPTPQPTGSPEVVAPQPDRLMLTLWHSWSGRNAQALDVLARRYEQSHPNIRVSLKAHSSASLVRDYSAIVADGNAPQLLIVPHRYLGELAERRHVLPLEATPLIERLGDLLPAAVEAGRVAGVLHGVPVTFESQMLFYDRRQMAEAPATLEPLLAFSPPQATATPDRSWALAYYLSTATTLPYLRAFDGGVFAADGTVVLDTDRREGTLRWLEWLQSLQADQRALTIDDFGAVDAMVQSNRAAAVIDWSHRLADYQRIWGDDAVGLAPLPRVAAESATPAAALLADVACINTVASAQQREAAVEFLQYLVSGPAQEILWSRGELFPVNQLASVDGAAETAIAMAPATVAFPNTVLHGRAWPLLDEMVRSVLSGSATPVEAVETAGAGLRALSPQP